MHGLPYLKLRTEANAIHRQEYGELRENHELALMGYTVSASSGMSADGRRLLLRQILDGGFLSKAEVMNHIEWLIHFNGNQPNMMNAIAEWRSDLAFLLDYKIDQQRSIWGKLFRAK